MSGFPAGLGKVGDRAGGGGLHVNMKDEDSSFVVGCVGYFSMVEIRGLIQNHFAVVSFSHLLDIDIGVLQNFK